MVKKRMKKSVKESNISFIKWFFRVLWTIIKIPYYLVKFIVWIIRKIRVEIKVNNVEKTREKIKAEYESFKIIKTLLGDFNSWEDNLKKSDSTIGLIIGARGSGKSAVGLKLLENLHVKTMKKIYAIGFRSEEMPSWVEVIRDINSVKNDSFVLVDEGGVLFNSRDSMKSANKILSELILISRHKNLSILFISQNSSNLEVNILRQADYLILKPASLLQSEFERKIIQKIYEQTSKGFESYSKYKGLSYIHSSQFKGFVTNPLPSFLKQSLSKSFSETKVK